MVMIKNINALNTIVTILKMDCAFVLSCIIVFYCPYIINRVMILVYVLLFTTFTVLITLVYLLVKKKGQGQDYEHFEEAQGQTDTIASQNEKARNITRSHNAIQSCEYLRPQRTAGSSSTSPNIMSGTSQDMMRRVLDGHRINIYKPEDDDPVAKDNMDSTKSYCYMYNDKKNNMKDYMLHKNGCTLENPIFKETPFITKVFPTLHKDSTHSTPMQKCVIEIDATKTTPDNLDSYWGKWGNTMCSSITDPLRERIREMDDQNTYLTDDINDLQRSTDTFTAKFDEAKTHFDTCKVDKDRETSDLSSITQNYQDEYDKYQQSEIDLNTHTNDRNNASTTKAELDDSIDKYTKLYERYNTLNDTCQAKAVSCDALKKEREKTKKEREEYFENVKSTSENLSGEEKLLDDRLSTVITENAVCQSDLNKTTLEYNEIKDKHDHEQTVLAACKLEEQRYSDLLDKYKEKANDMTANKDMCIASRTELRDLNKKCVDQRDKCRYLQKSHENAYVRLNAIKEKYDACHEKRLENRQVKQTLENQNVDLYNTLEHLLSRTYELEKSIYKNEHDQNMEFSKKVMDEYVEDLNTYQTKKIANLGCNDKSERIKDIRGVEAANAQLRYRIDTLKTQTCHFCDPTVKQCADKFPQEEVLCHEVMNA